MAREDLEIVIGASLDGLSSDLARAARMVRALGKDIERSAPRAVDLFGVGTVTRGLTTAASVARRAGAGFASATGALTGFVAKAGVAAVTLRAVDASIAGVGDAIRHVRESVSMAADLEQTNLAFEVMLGNAQKAQDMVAGLRKYAAQSPFSSKDIIGGGRQLLAYGVSADRILPTLKMLGDVSAGFGKDLPLNDLVYLYGTLFAQQRAYAVDVRQFAGRGVPIYEALAQVVGKTVEEVKDLIEQGRIGRDEVTGAFKAMTGEGGKFYRMTERQADTLAGSWEQMADAFDLAKVKLGQIIIRETGLKEIVKNGEQFGAALERNMERVAPFVRFVGDLGRAAGQVAYQLGRAAVYASDFAGALGDAAAPELKQKFRELQDYLKGVRENFRIDPLAVADTTYHIADRLVEIFADTLRGIRDMGQGLQNHIVRPLQEGLRRMLQTWADAKDLVGQATAAERFRPPMAFESDDSIVNRFRKLWASQLAAEKEFRALRGPVDADDDNPAIDTPKLAAARRSVAELNKARLDFLREFAQPELTAQSLLIDKGVVPNMPSRGPTAFDDGGSLERAVRATEKRREDLASGYKTARAELVASEARRKADEARSTAERVRDQLTGRMGLSLLGPVGQVAGQFPAPSGSGVKLMGDPRPGMMEAAKELRERFDPFASGGKLMEYRADLMDAWQRGKITPEMFRIGWGDAVRGVGERLGLGGPARLTDAVQVGSQEDARLLAQFATGNANESTDQLLAQIRDILANIAGTNKAMEQAPMPRPVSVVPAGGS